MKRSTRDRRRPANLGPAFPSPAPSPFVPPYRPSWFDRLKTGIERLPGPFWLPYLLLWLALFGVETLVHWSAAAFPIGTFRPFHAVLTVMFPGALCLAHGLDRLADRSFQTFRPVLRAPGLRPALPAELDQRLGGPDRLASVSSLAAAIRVPPIVGRS